MTEYVRACLYTDYSVYVYVYTAYTAYTARTIFSLCSVFHNGQSPFLTCMSCYTHSYSTYPILTPPH